MMLLCCAAVDITSAQVQLSVSELRGILPPDDILVCIGLQCVMSSLSDNLRNINLTVVVVVVVSA